MADFSFVTSAGPHSGQLSGTFAPGQVVRIAWTNVRKDIPGCGQYGYAVEIGTGAGEASLEQRFSVTTTSSSIELAISQPTSLVFFNAFTDTYCSTGALLGATFEVLGAAGTCVYGTRLKTGSAVTLILGQTGLEALLASQGLGWAAGFVLSFAFNAWDLNRLCSEGPGPLPVVDSSSIEASTAFWRRFLEYSIWLAHCECIPGTPAPISPAPISPTQPPNWPVAPVIPCDNVDICATLVALARQMAVMSDQVASTNQLVTLLQRYSLPFAYIRGATHSGLASQGSFAVSRLIGMDIDITQVPEAQRVLEGVPPYVWDLGWVSIMDGNGFIEEKRITRGQQVWLPRMMQEAVQFGWFFKPGVSGTLTELQAEP